MLVSVSMCSLHLVRVAEWSPFGKELRLLYVLLVLLLCLFVISVIFHFGFDDRILVLIVPVPGYCLLFTYTMYTLDVTHFSPWFQRRLYY